MRKPMDKSVLNTAEVLQGFGKVSPDDTRLDRPARHDLQSILDATHTVTVDPTWTPNSWDQKRINEWQQSVFGLGHDPLAERGVMDKLQSEVRELREALVDYAADDTMVNFHKVAHESADVVIQLTHLAGQLGIDLQHEVDNKMDINEKRDWDVNESGSGQHRE